MTRTQASRTRWGGLALAVALLATMPASALGASPAPAWSVGSLATPTRFVAGDTEGRYFYDVRVANIGSDVTDGSDVTIADILPEGLQVEGVKMTLRSSKNGGSFDYGPEACETTTVGATQTVTCTLTESLPDASEPALVFAGEEIQLEIDVFAPESLGEGATLTNHVEVEGGGAPAASITTQNETATLDNEGNPEPPPAGLTYLRSPLTDLDGLPTGSAGAHPFQLTTSFAVNTDTAPPGSSALFVPAGGDLKNIRLALPPGLIGNPTAAGQCTAQEFATLHTVTPRSGFFYQANACPNNSVVGIVLAQQIEGIGFVSPTPLYNLVPPPGMPAQFGFQIGFPFFINFEVRSGTDYGIDATLQNLTQVKRTTASTVIVWGTPGDPRHDAIRGSCLNPFHFYFPISFGDCPATGIDAKPSLRMPTSCADPLDLRMSINNWTNPGDFFSKVDSFPAPVGCNQLEFEPTLEARPTTDVADSPSGLSAKLHLPQNEDPEGRSTADLRDATVTLPKGLVLNPSSANGLAACSPTDIGLTSSIGALPVQFTPDFSSCPPAARIGTAEVNTPLLDHPLKGGVYVATPRQNPFGSLLALYIAVNDRKTGIALKLAGRVHADSDTGQLTTTFAENPQQPFEDFELDFFGGAGAALRTPAVCGNYSTTSSLAPWSAPESGPPATPSDNYAINKAPGGAACPLAVGTEPNSLSFDAGAEAPIAGAFSPFVMRLRREDGSQELSAVTVSPPPGLLGKLSGIPYCSEAALAAAQAKSGNEEKQDPSCHAASRVGAVTVGAGAGPAPFYTQGSAYLAGPYRGAPLSLAVITPATAGPYDLGTVVSRVALRLDPETARITAVSDPLPRILEGVPLDIRSLTVVLDRPGFTLNPTNCDPMATTGSGISVHGAETALSSPFQVGECSALRFKPKLSLRLTGKTNRGAHPALKATLKMPQGGANISRAVVTLPRSEFIDQSHFRTICTRVQYAEGSVPGERCPVGSVYGHVVARSPLLDQPLSGPVYLRSSSHQLPDLVLSLDGQVHIDAVGRVDSVNGRIRTTFETAPDAPISSLTLRMQGGKKGLFVNSTNICAKANRATVLFDGHNGKVADLRPVLKAKCRDERGEKRRGKKAR